MRTFNHGLDEKFVDALADLAGREGWWREVVRDRELVIAIRDAYLNVYWQGQSLFKVSMVRGAIAASTHPKYLLNPDLSGQVAFDHATGTFAPLKEDAITRVWEPGITLGRMKRAAAIYAADEKKGVQAVVQDDDAVVDVEIAFPASDITAHVVPRIDLARLEEGSGTSRLVFWEAKCLFNPELNLAVRDQIAAYRKVVDALRSDIIASYSVVARNLVAIANMSGGARTVAPAVARAAAGGEIEIGSPPEINLMVFGYDSYQRDGFWLPLRKKLEGALPHSRVEGRGDPKGLRLDPPRGGPCQPAAVA